MKRNSTTLFLKSPGATTPLPWVDNAPDFTGFTEPTLSVLQAAWSAFLESGEPLEIVPDPVISEPVPEPLWEDFLQPFYNPAHSGSPFDIIETKVQQAWLQTTDDQSKITAMTLRTHWSNCIIGFTNSSIRNAEWLNNSWKYLKYLLEQANQPLSEPEAVSIENLFKQYNLL